LRAAGYSSGVPSLGEEWIVDAGQCDPAELRDLSVIRRLLDEVVSSLSLRVVKEPLFHKFEGEGGVTGLYLLGESHLACHTYPEHQSLTLNLYSCTPKARFDYEGCLGRTVGAKVVRVQRVARGAMP
jgi:S-adenosylmethionine decarboxylase